MTYLMGYFYYIDIVTQSDVQLKYLNAEGLR